MIQKRIGIGLTRLLRLVKSEMEDGLGKISQALVGQGWRSSMNAYIRMFNLLINTNYARGSRLPRSRYLAHN